MRISDWSSDVCSSDLYNSLQGTPNRQATQVTVMNKPSLNTLLQEFETEQAQRKLPEFGPGDTVVVNVKVKEGNRERVQAYEGVVIGKKNAGLNSAFTVRKIRSEEHTSELQSLMRISYAVFCLKKKNNTK